MDAQTPPVVSTEALQSAMLGQDLLQAIADGPWTKQAELAARSGRPVKNIGRELDQLARAGLVRDTILTDLGVAALDALKRALNPDEHPGPDDTAANPVRAWTHADLTPNPDQPRKEFDPVQLGELAQSILTDGQVQNILARPNPYQPGPALQIVGGERRWRAIGLLIEYDKIPADYPVRVEVRDLTDAQVDSLALVENMQRANLKPTEEARAFQRLRRIHGWSNAQIAEKIGKDPRVVQLRLNLLELNGGLTEAEQHQLDTDQITITKALEILRNRPKPLELTPVKAMILAEVIAAGAGKEQGHYWREVECAPGAADSDPIAGALAQAGLLKFEGPHHFSGRYCVKFADFQVFDRFVAQYPDIAKPGRAATLLAIRATALGADEAERLDSEGGFATPWLNGPFELSPEGQAILDERAAADEAAKAKHKEWEAQHAAEEAAYQAEQDKARAALAAIRAFEADAPALSQVDFAARFDALMRMIGFTGPFTIAKDDQYGVVLRDGAGAVLIGRGLIFEAMRRLQAIAINYALACATIYSGDDFEPEAEEASAGPTISAPPTDPQAEDFDGEREPTGEAEFWTWVQARLQRMNNLSPSQGLGAAARCRARLTDEGECFGDDSRPWTLQCAVEIADDFAQDFADQLAGDDDTDHGFAEDGDDDGEDA